MSMDFSGIVAGKKITAVAVKAPHQSALTRSGYLDDGSDFGGFVPLTKPSTITAPMMQTVVGTPAASPIAMSGLTLNFTQSDVQEARNAAQTINATWSPTLTFGSFADQPHAGAMTNLVLNSTVHYAVDMPGSQQYGLDVVAYADGIGRADVLTGLRSTCEWNSSGFNDGIYAYVGYVQMDRGSANEVAVLYPSAGFLNSAQVTSYKTILVRSPLMTGTSTIGAAYGIYFDDHSAALFPGITSIYAIYVAGGLSRFGDLQTVGHVAIGASAVVSPTSLLSITDDPTDFSSLSGQVGINLVRRAKPSAPPVGNGLVYNILDVGTDASDPYNHGLVNGSYLFGRHLGSGTVTTVVGGWLDSWVNGPGTVTDMFGVYGSADLLGTANCTGRVIASYASATAGSTAHQAPLLAAFRGHCASVAGSMGADMAAVYYVEPMLEPGGAGSGGPVNTFYGLYVPDVTRPGTTSYGMYVTANLSRLWDLRVAGKVGFFDTAPAAKQTVAGSRGGNAAVQSLLAALSSYGLIADGTTA